MATTKQYFGRKNHKEDIRIAQQLCYPQVVIDKIKEEKDPIKRSRIFCDARNGKYDAK